MFLLTSHWMIIKNDDADNVAFWLHSIASQLSLHWRKMAQKPTPESMNAYAFLIKIANSKQWNGYWFPSHANRKILKLKFFKTHSMFFSWILKTGARKTIYFLLLFSGRLSFLVGIRRSKTLSWQLLNFII